MNIKPLLLLTGLFISVANVGCATNGSVSNDQSESDSTMVEIPEKHEPILVEASTTSNNVLVKPSYYNYETSDASTSERKALLDILSHLQEVDVLIRSAEAQQNPDQRIKFRYDWLRKDLYKVNRGVSDYLSSPESQPRSFDPVMGDYRR